MIIRTKKSPRLLGLDEPIRHENHKAPGHAPRLHRPGHAHRSGDHRRARGARHADRARGMPRAHVAGSRELLLPAACNVQAGAGKIPFIAFDLAGGANLNGSEILIGQSGNPLNFLSTAGYANARPAGQHDARLGQRGQPH